MVTGGPDDMIAPAKSSARLTWAAALACAASAALLGWQISRPDGPASSPPAAAAPEAAVDKAPAVDVAGFEFPTAETFEEVTDRPLFVRSRRAPTAEEKAAAAGKAGKTTQDAPPAEISLSGILVVGSRRVALVRLDSDPKVMHLSEGQEAGGWLVERIRPDRITVRRGENASELALEYKRKQPAPGQVQTRAGPRTGQQFQRAQPGLGSPGAPGSRAAPSAGSGGQPGRPPVEEEDPLQQ